MSTNNNIDWADVIKKEARGINDADLGEVQEVRQNLVITKAGVVDKEVYSIPKNLVEKYDGHNLWFRVTKEEAESQYKTKDQFYRINRNSIFSIIPIRKQDNKRNSNHIIMPVKMNFYKVRAEK